MWSWLRRMTVWLSKRGSSVGTGSIPPATPPTPVSVNEVLTVVKCVFSAPATVPR